MRPAGPLLNKKQLSSFTRLENPVMKTNITWIKAILVFAGLFNIGWGIIAVFLQPFFFHLVDMPGPHEATIWRSSGILAAVMGLGYLITSSNPFRYWPIVLMGLLTKVLMPLSLYAGFLAGELTSEVFRMAILNHVIWWLPFGAVLWRIYRQPYLEDRDLIEYVSGDAESSMEMYMTSYGRSVYDASYDKPVLLVFLRHFGCTFCREALHDLAHMRDAISGMGTRVVLVHMVGEDEAALELERYDLNGIEHVSDPESLLYKAFRLRRGNLLQLFGPRTIIRGLTAGLFGGHGLGSAMGDIYQMPGIFLVYKGRIMKRYYHATASDIPPYLELSACTACYEMSE